MVHEGLKSGQPIAKSEEHNCWFKKAERGDECALPLVLFSDVNVIESPCDIKLCKECGVLHVVD